MRLNHNLASLGIYREHKKVINSQSKSLNRISSGYKINNAAENPNKIAQSERLRIQIRGLQVAGRNVQDGVSMLQTADSAISSITSFIHRIRELTVQAGSGANSQEDRETIQNEINQMIEGIDNISSTTEFNGVKLIGDENVIDNSNTDKFVKMPIGANVGELIDIPKYDLSSDKLGATLVDGDNNYLKDIDVTDNLDVALEIVDNALDDVLAAAGKYGALEKRFEDSYKIIDEISSKLQNSESNIRDADVAEEMMEYTKSSLLVEAGNAMMVQTNKFPQEILRILENVRSR